MEKNSSIQQKICSVQYQFLENIQSITPGSDSFHKTVKLISGASWLEIYSSPASIDFKESKKDGDAGKYYDQFLDLNYPGEDEDNLNDFDEIENQRVILKINFSDNTSKIIGSMDNPVYIDTKYKSGPGGTGTVVSINHASPARAPWYEIVV